ncbi:hypothetical protein MKW98_001541 [Papaver atlanticum]|uniref:Alcohol dehydrogenase n=1 Tax=Papaver atlanticum TaxID=357466 RepID=A0AAD4S8R6_9MAGN|nr:hypothetical protein MKW98_001541 [Papaver atlanticum]
MEKTAGKPIRCRGAVCRAAGEALVIEEIEVAPPKAYEVRIKILCTSLCHSDVTFWKMPSSPMSIFPRIFGHEAVGVVESVGENVTDVKEGEAVVPVFFANCEDCRDCKSKKSNVCTAFGYSPIQGMPRDGTSRFTDSSGETVHNFFGVSSFSEYTVVDIAHVVKISPEIPIDKACLLSCGVSTGVGAAWKVADVEAESTVAIFGLGAVGLAVAEGARIRGASKIIGVDLNPEKFEIGRKFGVTDFINPKDYGEKPISEVIKEMTNGGADYCFECIGLASVMNDAFNSCRGVRIAFVSHCCIHPTGWLNSSTYIWLQGWGQTIILGVEMHGAPLSINTYELLRGKRIEGSFFGGIKAKTDIPLLAQSYLDKELNLDGFITHEIGFEEINTAFDLLIQGKSLRCIIWMKK